MDENKEAELSQEEPQKKSLLDVFNRIREKSQTPKRDFYNDNSSSLADNETIAVEPQAKLREKIKVLKNALVEFMNDPENDFKQLDQDVFACSLDKGDYRIISDSEDIILPGKKQGSSPSSPHVEFIVFNEERAEKSRKHTEGNLPECGFVVIGVVADSRFKSEVEKFASEHPMDTIPYSHLLSTGYWMDTDGNFYKDISLPNRIHSGEPKIGDTGFGGYHIKSEMTPEDYELCGKVINSLGKKTGLIKAEEEV